MPDLFTLVCWTLVLCGSLLIGLALFLHLYQKWERARVGAARRRPPRPPETADALLVEKSAAPIGQAPVLEDRRSQRGGRFSA